MGAVPGQILRSNADERSGEVGQTGQRYFVRQHAGIQYMRPLDPPIISATPAEAQIRSHNLYPQLDRTIGQLFGDDIGSRLLVWHCGKHLQLATFPFDSHVEVVKLRAVVIADESGGLLEILWIKVEDRAGFECEMLLPTRDEREAIWQIQIAKYQRQPEQFDLAQLAKVADGFTGSEIEQVFVEALYRAFDPAIKIVIFDEPMAHCDVEIKRMFYDNLKEFSEKIVLVIAHDPLYLSFFNRVISMKSGRIVADVRGTRAISDITESVIQDLAVDL